MRIMRATPAAAVDTDHIPTEPAPGVLGEKSPLGASKSGRSNNQIKHHQSGHSGRMTPRITVELTAISSSRSDDHGRENLGSHSQGGRPYLEAGAVPPTCPIKIPRCGQGRAAEWSPSNNRSSTFSTCRNASPCSLSWLIGFIGFDRALPNLADYPTIRLS